jgi:Ca2+-binding EF-hand superfamily protein
MPNVAEELCDKLDKNNDGAIDFDEFVDGCE